MASLTSVEVDWAAGLLLAGAAADSLTAGSGAEPTFVTGTWTEATCVAMDIAVTSTPWDESFSPETPGPDGGG